MESKKQFILLLVRCRSAFGCLFTNLLKKEYISSRDEIVNKKIRVYYHIEPIGRDYLEKTITDFKKNIKGVFDIIEYGEVEKNE